MANLNKLLVHVPSNLCDGFKTKYVTATTNRNTSYDNKVVFLEKTQEIFTQGKLYGTNIEDFSALKALVGTIPDGAASNNIVGYISEMISNADHIHSVSKQTGETLIDVTTSNKAVTINSTTTLTTAITKANSAMQRVSVLGKTLNNTTNSISVAEAQTALQLKGAAYKDSSYFATPADVKKAKDDVIGVKGNDKGANTIYGAKAYADNAAAGVVAKLPVVTNGSGIVVTPNTDSNGKTTYTVSTSVEVWHYKGNKTTKEQLPASDNTTGDVWSVGPADAEGSTLYAWDGDEWINIGGPNGVTDVNKTESHGVKLDKNPDGTVQVKVTPGSIDNGNGSVVTGGAVYSAILATEGRCDAKGTAKGLIDNLGGSATSSNGTYVNVTVTTSKGEASTVTVTETNALKTAVTHANSAVQTINCDSPYLGATKTGTTVKLDLDETEVFNYVTNNIWETYSA